MKIEDIYSYNFKNISSHKGGVKFKIKDSDPKKIKKIKEITNALEKQFIWLSNR